MALCSGAFCMACAQPGRFRAAWRFYYSSPASFWQNTISRCMASGAASSEASWGRARAAQRAAMRAGTRAARGFKTQTTTREGERRTRGVNRGERPTRGAE